MWDMAFHGEDRLIVSHGSPSITCQGVAVVYSVTTLTEEGRLSLPPCGIHPSAGVRVDASRDRLYLLSPSSVSVYSLTDAPPTWISTTSDNGFTRNGALTPDGQRLVFSSGRVYDALTLGFLADVGRTGDLAIDPAGAYAYFTQGMFIDRVRLSDYAVVARYAFEANPGNGPFTIHSLEVDGAGAVAYVVTPVATNANILRAVPLSAAILDPSPWDGWVWPRNVFAVRATLSGGIDPATVAITVDGIAVAHGYDPTFSQVWHAPASEWPEGLHRVVVTGRDSVAAEHRLEWSFTVDTRPPEIRLDLVDPVYRTSDVTVTGRIVDATLAMAEANYTPLTVDPVTGAFSFRMSLEEGANSLFIRARDRAYNENVSSTWVVYVPPTTRYVDADAGFSVEYPTNWSLEQDVVSGDVVLDAVMTGASGANMNAVEMTGLPNYTEADLLAAAEEVYGNLSSLPGFGPYGSPRPFEIPGLLAVTYEFEWRSPAGRVFQRQILVAEPTVRRAWVLTFTSPYLGWTRYDPLFQWMVTSFRYEAPGSGPGPSNAPVLPYLLVGLAIAGALAALAVALVLRRRRRTVDSLPPQARPPAGPAGPPAPPSLSPLEPPKDRPPPGG
jgi:hypothetical protein